MILDLKEVAKLERKYQNHDIALNALNNMVQNVSQVGTEELEHPNLAITTLVELGILKSSSDKKPQQLNS